MIDGIKSADAATFIIIVNAEKARYAYLQMKIISKSYRSYIYIMIKNKVQESSPDEILAKILEKLKKDAEKQINHTTEEMQ